MWRQIKRSKVGLIGLVIIAVVIFLSAFADFISAHPPDKQFRKLSYLPPQRVHVFYRGKLAWPYVWERKAVYSESGELIYKRTEERISLRPFRHGWDYKLLGLIPTDVHLLPKGVYLLGTDKFGRDYLSRVLHGGRISLSLGPVSLIISMTIGILVGTISGYFGGIVDMVIQRLIEVVMSFPALPLWLALASAIPAGFSSVLTLYMIIAVFALIGWAGLARVVRGMVLSIKEQEFVLAARVIGCSDLRIMVRHLVPNVASYLIVSATLALPGLIIGESTISFLGLGIKDPYCSWGSLLSEAQSLHVLKSAPWLLAPGFLIVTAVLAFNFFGDALRDALDPFKAIGEN